MVQKILSIAIFSAFGLCAACGESATEGSTAGSIIVLEDILPSSGSQGAHVEIIGVGFSFVAEENAVIFINGGSTTTLLATSYRVTNDGDEAVGFNIPNSVSLGENNVLVNVEGETSNILHFTVIP